MKLSILNLNQFFILELLFKKEVIIIFNIKITKVNFGSFIKIFSLKKSKVLNFNLSSIFILF